MERVYLAVKGTLMRGLQLNGNLQAVGATFVRETTTEPVYRLWPIEDRYPVMMRVATGGNAIAVEDWAILMAGLGKILWQNPDYAWAKSACGMRKRYSEF